MQGIGCFTTVSQVSIRVETVIEGQWRFTQQVLTAGCTACSVKGV